MTFKKGDPNINRAGRPKKQRALTEVLSRQLSKRVKLVDGTEVSGKEYVASLAVQAISFGEITLANGATLPLKPEEIIAIWQFAYKQIDGPPTQKSEISGPDGQPLPAPAAAVLIYEPEKEKLPDE